MLGEMTFQTGVNCGASVPIRRNDFMALVSSAPRSRGLPLELSFGAMLPTRASAMVVRATVRASCYSRRTSIIYASSLVNSRGRDSCGWSSDSWSECGRCHDNSGCLETSRWR